MRRLVLGLAAMAAVLATAPPARAADGDPYVQACIVAFDATGCATNAALLGRPAGVAVSPDDRQVYVTTDSGALQTVDRDLATGALTPRATGTTAPVSLAGATSLTMSHDGSALLVVAGGDVLEFSRDLGTGTLTYVTSVTGLAGGAYSAAFSPDDRFVYVRTFDGLYALRRDGQAFTQIGCFAKQATGNCLVVPEVAGVGYQIGASQDAVVVPFSALDGQAQGGGGVAAFQRNPGDGTLIHLAGTTGGCVSLDGKIGDTVACLNGGPGSLFSSTLATISPDGHTVYVGGGGAVTALPLTGGALQAPTGSASMTSVLSLAPTPDGVVASTYGSQIAYFSRAAATGALAPLPGTKGCMAGETGHGCAVLGGLLGDSSNHAYLAADPNGLDVYATAGVKGMLAGIVRDYAPVCHASSVTLAFETATAIHPDCADPNGDPLTYTVTSPPHSGTLSSALLYTPAAGFSGADQFTYFATGHGVSSAPATVALGVFRAPPVTEVQPPVVVHTSAPRRTVGALVGTRWEIHGTRFSLLQLSLSQLPKTWTAQIRCAGKHCPFARKTLKGRAKHGTASVLGSLKRSQRRFRAGQTLEVWVSAPGLNTKVARLVLKRGRIPSTQALCVVPGAKKATSRCG